MEVRGSYLFDAPAARVWEVLLDQDIMARCMPGCEKLTALDSGRYEATISVGVGAIKGTYLARITIVDLMPMHSYKLVIEGAGSSGFVRGEARVSLAEQEGKTMVNVVGEAQVGGIIARVGQRLMGSVNKMMMDRLFTCLQEVASHSRQGP